ncbi:hypothetical protein TNCV_2182431 [Trichonephila clavipes]|uniref:Uncharacterized protein n=1 Tax=Trichonephila clavipes TaxID=2585209 RepID=A0A8X7B9P2_TRICX|nr:hypothetical protein TNCV_2182431 [Trichonephila clavipes]
MDLVILNHGQVMRTRPELIPPLLITTPHQREDVCVLDRFNVYRPLTRRGFSGTGLELMTWLSLSDTLTTVLPQHHSNPGTPAVDRPRHKEMVLCLVCLIELVRIK